MAHTTRSQFLTSIAAAAAPLAATPCFVAHKGRKHAFLASQQSDVDEEHLWHGYPDECYAFTTFADSLVALAWGHGWYMQPPMVDLRNAVVVDFASITEDEAEASLACGWNGAWEFPIGIVNTIASRTEVNSQNARFERHMALIGTAMRQPEFHEAVIDELLDARTHPGCQDCSRRLNRQLGDVFTILARGTDQSAVQLFSQWQPSDHLRDFMLSKGTSLKHHPLSTMPREDLEANRAYHIWDGTPLQAEEFRKTVWAPAWRRARARR